MKVNVMKTRFQNRNGIFSVTQNKIPLLILFR